MAHSISLQYMEPDDATPRAGYEFTDGGLELPEGAPVPRIGEFMQLILGDSSKSYVVLAVHTRLFMLDPKAIGWHSVVTLGPGAQVADQRLLIIRE
ncbi:hypothetical protein ACQ4W7_23975 [Janthinobacterium sp. MDT1-19]